jgi:hypothetical protein
MLNGLLFSRPRARQRTYAQEAGSRLGQVEFQFTCMVQNLPIKQTGHVHSVRKTVTVPLDQAAVLRGTVVVKECACTRTIRLGNIV